MCKKQSNENIYTCNCLSFFLSYVYLSTYPPAHPPTRPPTPSQHHIIIIIITIIVRMFRINSTIRVIMTTLDIQ